MNEQESLERFKKFHEGWREEMEEVLRRLRTAEERRRRAAGAEEAEEAEEEVRRAVGRVMGQCREYHAARREATEADVVGVVAGWSSSSSALERSLQWVGGWRPTTLFHLVYTQSSILFESRILDILRGSRSDDLSDLSPSQFRRVSDLQCETVKEENDITEELSEWQDDATELVTGTAEDLRERIQRLAGIVRRADDLRLITVVGLVALLSPLQAAQFLNAAADLQAGIHRWGLGHDRRSPSDV